MALADALLQYQQEKPKKSSSVTFKGIVDAYLQHRTAFSPFHMRLERNRSVGFHPSGLHEVCPRQISYQYLFERELFRPECSGEIGENKFKSPKMELLFDFGHLIHGLIQYGYLPCVKDLDFKAEVSLTGLLHEYLIAGTVDLIVTLQDGRKYVVDIKTMRSESFYKTNSVEDISDEYITQLNLYMYGLKIPRGLFFLVNKNDSETKEVFLDMDKKIVNKALATASQAKEYLQGKQEPPILLECRKKTGEYKRCPFTSICFSKKPLLALTVAKDYSKFIA